MDTKILFTFAAIAAMLGTVGVVGVQPASAQLSGSLQAEQLNDQGDCISDCSNSQSFQDSGGDSNNNQENTSLN